MPLNASPERHRILKYREAEALVIYLLQAFAVNGMAIDRSDVDGLQSAELKIFSVIALCAPAETLLALTELRSVSGPAESEQYFEVGKVAVDGTAVVASSCSGVNCTI